VRRIAHEPGRLSERLMEPVLKTGEPKGSRGSNCLPLSDCVYFESSRGRSLLTTGTMPPDPRELSARFYTGDHLAVCLERHEKTHHQAIFLVL